MSAFLVANIAPIMFGSLALFMVLGYPIAFSLAALGLFYGIVGIELGLFAPTFLQALPDRVFAVMANETLLAIPFFTFMGIVLERSRMAEDLLETMGQVFGPAPGGLAYAAIFVGALLAATTGVIAAAVISMGLISLPIMLRHRYDRSIAAGVIVASGTLAQILPPSLVLIVLADQLGRSVGDMYAGALIPALTLTALYALYVFLLSLARPQLVPPLPPEARTLGRGLASLGVAIVLAVGAGWLATMFFAGRVEQGAVVYGAATGAILVYAFASADGLFGLGALSLLARRAILTVTPPLSLIFLVLGTIFVGIATPTEAGAMGAVGALALALANGRLTFRLTREAGEATARLCAFVIFVLIGARVFALTFYGVNGHLWLKDLLLALPGGESGFLAFVGVVIFFLGFFLDFFEIVFILVPLLIEPARVLDIDLIWFGVLLALNFQTSFLTPPFGFALFYLRSVAPAKTYVDAVTGERIRGIDTLEIYRGALPFVAIQVLMIVIVFLFPGMVTHYRVTGPDLDPAEVERRFDQLILPGLDGGGMPGMPSFDPPPTPRFE